VEVCFTARAPDLSRLGMCALGIGYQSQVGARSILWVYTEPRFRILGKSARGHSNWETGALFRIGLGEIERSPSNPWIFAPGAYVARQMRNSGTGPSWSVQASYHHALFNGFPDPVLPGLGRNRPRSDRLTLGLGWYQ
jgi:hypothetical protein